MKLDKNPFGIPDQEVVFVPSGEPQLSEEDVQRLLKMAEIILRRVPGTKTTYGQDFDFEESGAKRVLEVTPDGFHLEFSNTLKPVPHV